MTDAKKPIADELIQDEAKLRRYLLGRSTAEEASEIELTILTVGAKPILGVVEDELIEEYLTGQLDEIDRDHFEKRLLRSDQIIAKVRISALLLNREDAAGKIKSQIEIPQPQRLPLPPSPEMRPHLSEPKSSMHPRVWELSRRLESKRQNPIQFSHGFHAFDLAYVQRLREKDTATMEHFVKYFGELLQLHLRSRLNSPESIEDIRQETFVRVLSALRDGKITKPERLGSFVFSICKNILMENRISPLDTSLADGQQEGILRKAPDTSDLLAAKEKARKVREILEKLPEHDRRLLREIFIEGRDKNEVCADHRVDSNYLRVLLHRVKRFLKAT